MEPWHLVQLSLEEVNLSGMTIRMFCCVLEGVICQELVFFMLIFLTFFLAFTLSSLPSKPLQLWLNMWHVLLIKIPSRALVFGPDA